MTQTTTTAPTLLAEMTESLIAEGYSPGRPSRISAVAEAIDRACAAEAACDGCQHVGLGLHAWQRGESYRAVAYCPTCAHAIEI